MQGHLMYRTQFKATDPINLGAALAFEPDLYAHI